MGSSYLASGVCDCMLKQGMLPEERLSGKRLATASKLHGARNPSQTTQKYFSGRVALSASHSGFSTYLIIYYMLSIPQAGT